MSEQVRTLYCENGCGEAVNVRAEHFMLDREIEEISVKLECKMCSEVTEYMEDLTVSVTFKCSECDQEKEANIEPTRGRAKTVHQCGNCNKRTEWREVGWESIEVS